MFGSEGIEALRQFSQKFLSEQPVDPEKYRLDLQKLAKTFLPPLAPVAFFEPELWQDGGFTKQQDQYFFGSYVGVAVVTEVLTVDEQHIANHSRLAYQISDTFKDTPDFIAADSVVPIDFCSELKYNPYRERIDDALIQDTPDLFSVRDIFANYPNSTSSDFMKLYMYLACLAKPVDFAERIYLDSYRGVSSFLLDNHSTFTVRVVDGAEALFIRPINQLPEYLLPLSEVVGIDLPDL